VEEILPVRHYDWIAHFGRRTPDKLAVADLASERRFSYAQFDARIARLAAHLRDRLKIRRGDRVAVLAMNTTDTLEVQFACGRIGAVFLPLNTRLTVPELQYIVGDAGPTLMIHDAELADVALSVAKLCNVPSALLLGPDGSYEAAIAEAAVIGIPSEQWGETGMAIIAVKPGHTLTEAEICAHCEANLARFKRPHQIRRCAAAQCHRQDPQADLAQEFRFAENDRYQPRRVVTAVHPPKKSPIKKRYLS
jgi:acyl-CoA synthetase (AMP-forming)/AMP-acid ligase II